jgi:hypothetical protein
MPLPLNGEEFKTFIADENNGLVVRNLDHWKVAVETKDNPLSTVEPELLDSFARTLTFENGGLGHAEYGMLADKLTAEQFEHLWALFGISPAYFEQIKDTFCAGHGTCQFRPFVLCTSNC